MLKITSLVENTSRNHDLEIRHGLSLFIETSKHKILFDLGPDKTFSTNASRKGINLNEVDIVVISHGHLDHGGGLPYFLKINNHARVYIKKEAFEEHYSKRLSYYNNVGISELNLDQSRFIFVDDYLTIDDELTLFSNVTGRKLFSSMNSNLHTKVNDLSFKRDNFNHEQYLIVSDNDRDILFTGCSHNGVVNIVEKYDQIKKDKNSILKYVIGGFHLYSEGLDQYEDEKRIIDLGKWIISRKENYLTCHCTGEKAFSLLRDSANEKVSYLRCGDSLVLE